LACRYRWWYEDFLKPRNEVIPLFLTEVNLAKDLPGVSVNEWLKQMAWYDERLREDYYAVGAHIFSLGGAGGWDKYDFTRMLPVMVQHMISVKDTKDPVWPGKGAGLPAPVPPVTPEPPVVPPVEPEPPIEQPPTQCRPREPYDRHYVLLPPGADWRWIAACQRYWERFHVTIGSSADDAAYGPGLGERAVTAVNPAQWGDDLKVFFDTHYSGVRYDPIVVETPQELEQVLNRRADLRRRFG
jgi:hypothetical protein